MELSCTRRLEVLALIPARSGSRSIAHKNIRSFAGKPLLVHSIEHARASSLISRVLVSTDSQSYAELAREHGAEVPFLRPPEISGDLSSDLEVFQHALSWLRTYQSYTPDICVHLRPTYPLRRIDDVDAVIRILIDRPDFDSVRSVCVAKQTPYKMWHRQSDGTLTAVVRACGTNESYNFPRQALPEVFYQNACIDAVRSSVIVDKNSMTGDHIYGYVMRENFDIDSHCDFQKASQEARVRPMDRLSAALARGRRVLCIDIDGVIASLSPDNDYTLAEPLWRSIRWVNRLHEQGHRIILFTARGSTTGVDWRELTLDQLKSWGVNYDAVLFGKPAADFYIDDKGLSWEEVEWLTRT